ncbi:hypothetical protein DAETH_43910 (plasmid) [Deinococcus aetherius]|uniref:Antitoxin n=1 Tax=Deinococcus aetherius TaxID=200252 RepID=A0ABM8AKT9_9DEIO|nr:BrnA antitoxin family protein [Deinococcus aetherius]BDP44422.1 hypothetical protein DAETH_43910 [Deinococcus aetherius]
MPEDLIIVNDPSEIPAFETEAEEAEFWATHAMGDAMFDRAEGDPETQAFLRTLPTRPRRSNPVSLRLGVDLERRLRRLAEVKGTPYQTLLKEFVLERVYEEEKRHHLL